MSSLAVTPSQKRALGVTTAAALLVGVYFLHAYFLLIVLAAIVAYIFNPFYKWLLAKGRRPSSAASITFCASVLAFIIPIALVVFVSVHQILNLIHTITAGNYSTNLNDLLQRVVDDCNRLLRSWHIPYQLSVTTVTNGVSHGLKAFGQSLLSGLSSSVSSFFNFFSLAIIYIYVFLSVLVKQDTLLETFHLLNPLGKDISHIYTRQMASMTKAMVRGQFIIALAQGLTDAVLLYIGGLHSTFFFFFLLLTTLSIIPLGGGIVAIPIGVIMVLTGNIWQGLLVIFGHLVIVTNIDNVLRPRLVPRDARLDPALTLLAVFAGLRFFGFLGIIIGPVLMILIVTTIQVFLEVYHGVEAGAGAAKKSRRSKWAFWRRSKASEASAK
jgi:predicted PurR-regulated permease PerM